MNFYIRCVKEQGHGDFTIRTTEVKDGDGNLTGDRILQLVCAECGEEAILEVNKEVAERGGEP